MSTLKSNSQTQLSSILKILILALIIFKFAYPKIYSLFSFNRSWPLERVALIKEQIDSLEKNKPVNLILGSCGGESSIRADVLTKITGEPWLNFSLRGAQPSFLNKLLVKLKNENVQIGRVLFVIEATDLTIQQENNAKRFVTQDFDKRIFGIKDIILSNDSLPEKLDLIFSKVVYSDILPWVFTQSLLMEFSSSELENIKQFRAFTIQKSFEDFNPWNQELKGTVTFNYPHSFGLIEKQQEFLKNNFDKYLNYSEALEGRISLVPGKQLIKEYLSTLKSYSGQSKEVIVLLPPEFPALFKSDKSRSVKIQAFQKIFEEEKIKLFNRTDFGENPLNSFLDFDHLSFEASALFSEKLAVDMYGVKK